MHAILHSFCFYDFIFDLNTDLLKLDFNFYRSHFESGLKPHYFARAYSVHSSALKFDCSFIYCMYMFDVLYSYLFLFFPNCSYS